MPLYDCGAEDCEECQTAFRGMAPKAGPLTRQGSGDTMSRFMAVVTGTIFGVALGVPLGLGIVWVVGETVEHFTR